MLKLILLLIISCISLSQACRFVRRTNEQIYCNSDFAGIITVATNGFPCGPYNYNLCYGINNVQQINGDSINPYILETAPSTAGCGVELTPGNTYFIASNVVDPYVVGLYTYELYEDWTALSPADVVTATQAYEATICPAIDPPTIGPIEPSPTKGPIKILPTTGPIIILPTTGPIKKLPTTGPIRTLPVEKAALA